MQKLVDALTKANLLVHVHFQSYVGKIHQTGLLSKIVSLSGHVYVLSSRNIIDVRSRSKQVFSALAFSQLAVTKTQLKTQQGSHQRHHWCETNSPLTVWEPTVSRALCKIRRYVFYCEKIASVDISCELAARKPSNIGMIRKQVVTNSR